MNNQAVKEAAEVLNRNAIEFTHTRYVEPNQKAIPFWFPFIPKPYLNTDVLNAGLGLLGISIRPGETKTIPIQIGLDAVYRLINIKFTPYQIAQGAQIEAGNTITAVAGSTTITGAGTTFTTTITVGQPYMWTNDAGRIKWGRVKSITDNTHFELEVAADSAATAVSIYRALFVSHYGTTSGNINPPNLYFYKPLTQMLRATYVLTSLRTRYLLGGSQWQKNSVDNNQSGTQERPLLISALQGINDGLAQLRTESLIATLGVISIKVTNLHSETVLLNGTLFGYKISLGGA